MNDELPILVESNGAIVTITLNRPAALNALDHAMADALLRAIEAAGAAPATRCVILRGSGRSFCGGGDVAAMHANRSDRAGFLGSLIDGLHACIKALNRLRVPVIASVHGSLAGAGISLALACDLVVAARGARVTVAYPQLGAPADGGLTYQLVHRLGASRAFDLMTLRGTVEAQEALAMGLFNRVCDDDDLAAEAERCALALAALPEQAVAEIKQLIAGQAVDGLDAQLSRERAAFMRCAVTAEFDERVTAFAERMQRKGKA